MPKIPLPHDAHTAIDVARLHGGRALLVGGAVRDIVLGIEPKDFDIEVHDMTEETFRGVFATSLRTFGRVDEVGVSFGVIKFGRDIDISLPRRDSKTGDGHKGFTITVDTDLTIEEALARRDFTINAMAFDPATERFIDPFGGRNDAFEKVLRHVGPAFAEDPLRVMRGVQFAARFGFTLAPETAEFCRQLLREQKHLAKERLWGEWEKILTKGLHFEAFQQALRDTMLDQILPWGFLGRSGREETRVAQLFHGREDKPAAILASWARSYEGTKVHGLFEQLGVPLDMRRTARRMRDGALFVEMISGGHWTATDARWIARRIAPVSIEQVVKIATGPEAALAASLAAKAADVFHGPIPAILTGDALIELGWTPGPAFGPVLKAALEAQDRGEFTTRDEAMTMAQEGKFGEWGG